MAMSGNVTCSCVACLWLRCASINMSAALLRLAAESMGIPSGDRCQARPRRSASIKSPTLEPRPTFDYIMDMRRDEVIARLKQAEPALRARGIRRAAVFGSVARGEERPDSDIDIMVEFE